MGNGRCIGIVQTSRFRSQHSGCRGVHMAKSRFSRSRRCTWSPGEKRGTEPPLRVLYFDYVLHQDVSWFDCKAGSLFFFGYRLAGSGVNLDARSMQSKGFCFILMHTLRGWNHRQFCICH